MSRQAHYLRHNKDEWSPTRVVCIDTETRQKRGHYGNVHTYRLGAATFDDRMDGRGDGREPDRYLGRSDPLALWEWVSAHADRERTTWVYAHNLDFDAASSRALGCLRTLGYEITQLSTAPRCSYVRLRRGRRRLVLADSVSLFPTSIAAIGRALGYEQGEARTTEDSQPKLRGLVSPGPKLPMPDDDDDDEAWETYCRRDVDILRAAVLALMRWWDTERFGHWGLSGASLGWSAYRHRFLTHPVLVHDDKRATELERGAYYGGRREVYRVGTLPEGTYPYLDFRAHYATVAARTEVPTRLLGVWENIDVGAYRKRKSHVGLIANVEVDTDVPNIPVRSDRGIVYPIGRFRTTLAGPELDACVLTARSVRIIRGAYYRLAPALGAWGEWILDAIDPERSSLPPILQLAAKGWSRSVPGKFGQLNRETRRVGRTTEDDYGAERLYSVDSPRTGMVTRAGGSIFTTWIGGEPDNAVPAIAAWITSQARVDLWDLMQAVGRDRVLWVDTDGIILDGNDVTSPRAMPPGPDGSGRSPILDPDWWLPGAAAERFRGRLTVKAVHRSLAFYLPGDYRVDGRAVTKGLPAGARQTGERSWSAELWPGLLWQLDTHKGRAFETWTRDLHYRKPYDRGIVTENGRVEPLRMEWDGCRNVIPTIIGDSINGPVSL